MKDTMVKRRRIARALVRIAKTLVGTIEPDLYILNDDGSVTPIYLPDEQAIAASRKKKRPFTGKQVFLTPKTCVYYKNLDQENKKTFQDCCKELKNRGTLEGNKYAEKVSGGLFAIRLTQGLTNERFFYCYNFKQNVIVFEAYEKQSQKIPTDTRRDAERKVVQYMNLTSTEGLLSFDDILREEKENQRKRK